jgi:hypothetical protein
MKKGQTTIKKGRQNNKNGLIGYHKSERTDRCFSTGQNSFCQTILNSNNMKEAFLDFQLGISSLSQKN